MEDKIAIYIGHTRKGDKGAYSEVLGMTEFEYNEKVAEELKKLNPDRYDIFEHSIQNYYDRQKKMAENVRDYLAVIELHFNSFTPKANGTESLYYFNSKLGKILAQELSQGVVRCFGTTLRGDFGAKAIVNKKDRGYWFVYLSKPVAVIFEPFFGSNEEAKKFTNYVDVAKSIDESIDKYLKGIE